MPIMDVGDPDAMLGLGLVVGDTAEAAVLGDDLRQDNMEEVIIRGDLGLDNAVAVFPGLEHKRAELPKLFLVHGRDFEN